MQTGIICKYFFKILKFNLQKIKYRDNLSLANRNHSQVKQKHIEKGGENMKIAIVGKGGSGKSSVSWLLSSYLSLYQNKKIMVVDADYNLDTLQAFSMQEEISLKYLNECEPDFYNYLGLTEQDYYVDLPAKKNLKRFSFYPPDEFTQKYSTQLTKNHNIHLMAAGPINDRHLYGHRCSHAYISALKFYIPLLELKTDEYFFCDSVAGTDMVSYGLYLGIDVMLVVVELTRNSIGVYHQIKAIADEFKIPVRIILNKISSEEQAFIQARELLGDDYLKIWGYIPMDFAVMNANVKQLHTNTIHNLEKIYAKMGSFIIDVNAQWQRHVDWKVNYDKEFEKSKHTKFSFI
jgi:CO dehydrogenase maturation factor